MTSTDMSLHHCHATDCNTVVPPRIFMCKRHWFRLPQSMRDAVWAAYVPGQERRKDPTDRYLTVTREAIRFIEQLEGK